MIKKIRDFQIPVDANRSIKHKKILFVPFAPHQLNILRESVLAHACRLRGAEAKMVSYDLHNYAIDFISPKTKKDLRVIYRVTKKLHRITGIPAVYLSLFEKTGHPTPETNMLEPVDIENLEYKGIFLGDLVIASTVRYFLCNGPEWENPLFLQRARDFVRTAKVLIDCYESLLNREKPDKIVTSHGIYVSWGTLFRLARKHNIPIDVYGTSYRKNTLRFYHNTPNAPFPAAEWPDYKDVPLTDSQKRIIESYSNSRATQNEDNITLFDKESTLPEIVKQFIQNAKSENHKLFCLFSNISWDAFMFRKGETTFSTMTEWLTETIDHFSKQKNVSLIIKGHPAERYHQVPEKYRVKKFIPGNLPSNILFLDENANVKPFDLYPLIDVGIIYISTVSVEMALQGITVLTAGVGGHYSDKGFTIDPESKEQYFSYIGRIIDGTLNWNPNIEMAQKYMYYRFFREALEFRYLDIKKYQVKRINIDSGSDLLPGKNETLDLICNGILNDRSFLNVEK